MNADALSATAAAQAALAAMRAAAGSAGAMERHCSRQFAIAERLAGDREFDHSCWCAPAGCTTSACTRAAATRM